LDWLLARKERIEQKLASLLFEDKELDEARWKREAVQQKKQRNQTQDGQLVHSLHSLFRELATRCKNTCRVGEGKTNV